MHKKRKPEGGTPPEKDTILDPPQPNERIEDPPVDEESDEPPADKEDKGDKEGHHARSRT